MTIIRRTSRATLLLQDTILLLEKLPRFTSRHDRARKAALQAQPRPSPRLNKPSTPSTWEPIAPHNRQYRVETTQSASRHSQLTRSRLETKTMDHLRRCLVAGLVALSTLQGTASLQAQGVLLIEDAERIHPIPRPIPHPHPIPPATYRVTQLEIEGTVQDQSARLQISQTFRNTGSRVVEGSFIFPLPADAVVENLTLLVDGKEFGGKLLPKDEARRIYEDYVRRCQDPALLEWMGGGLFRTSVFPIPPGAERKVTLEFTQLLRRIDGVNELNLPLAMARYSEGPLDLLKIRLSLAVSGKLQNIFSPSYPLNIERTDPSRAVVTYEAKSTIPGSDLRLFFDAGDAAVGASLLSDWSSEDDAGHFLLLVAPEFAADAPPLAKDVVIVVDRSGSMSGKKIEQVRESLRFVVERLADGDRFNVISYSNTVERFRPELEIVSPETRAAALGYAHGLFAGGSTNISEALETALPMLSDPQRPSFLIFLTDGLPTAGETNEAKIVEICRGKTPAHVRMISLGVGYDVNGRLLDRLSQTARGRTEYVRPDESIETYIARVYRSISSPVLTNVQAEWRIEGRAPEAGPIVTRTLPDSLPDVFVGEQIVVAGRHHVSGNVSLTLKGQVGAAEKAFEFTLPLAERGAATPHRFVAKLWASRRIGQIIDELDLKGPNSELVDELVGLSTRYGILTPYTSFLADDRPTIVAGGRGGAIRAAEERLDALADTSGASGFAQRSFKQNLLRTGGGDAAMPAPGNAAEQAALAFGGTVLQDIASDEQKVVSTVRSAGQTALYRRGDFWIDAQLSDIDPQQLPADVQRVERYSEAYFALVAENSADENALLSQQDAETKLLIRLRGQLFLIE